MEIKDEEELQPEEIEPLRAIVRSQQEEIEALKAKLKK